jgi:hypothetical protein
MKRVLAVLIAVWVSFTPELGLAVSGNVQLFASETAAQVHCPTDTVVWLNTPSGIYHFKGMRWYGRTNQGAYLCQKEGDQAGYRATRNGQ